MWRGFYITSRTVPVFTIDRKLTSHIQLNGQHTCRFVGRIIFSRTQSLINETRCACSQNGSCCNDANEISVQTVGEDCAVRCRRRISWGDLRAEAGDDMGSLAWRSRRQILTTSPRYRNGFRDRIGSVLYSVTGLAVGGIFTWKACSRCTRKCG